MSPLKCANIIGSNITTKNNVKTKMRAIKTIMPLQIINPLHIKRVTATIVPIVNFMNTNET